MADLQKIEEVTKTQTSGTGAQPQTSDQVLATVNRALLEKAVQERANELKIPYLDIGQFPINPDVLLVVREADASAAMLVPFFKSGKKLRVAVNDPEKPETKALLQRLQGDDGYECQINLASDVGIRGMLQKYQSLRPVTAEPIRNVLTDEQKRLFEKELKNLAETKQQILNLPAEEALNALHVSAIKAGASDIHYQPDANTCTIRFRIDGVLHAVFEIPIENYKNLANQLKYKAGMKLNITNIPQDGRFEFIVNDRQIDVRISALPTKFGESFVCRILDSGMKVKDFEALGFTGKSFEVIKKAAAINYGMILCTGPTGSGKTTTLYAFLNGFNTPERKIITLEDPIEYHITGIVQSQINEKRNYTFASGLRSILRQDPNVVMIGEIRDLDTAQTAAQAALTGHVVLSTLHTNSAVETIPRLLTIGVPPFMVAPALHTVIAQRLVRRICPKCVEGKPITSEEKRVFEETIQAIQICNPQFSMTIPAQIKSGKGCAECNDTGFRGQLVLAEAFVVTDDIRAAILAQAPSSKILELARKLGMITMREDGILKVMQGFTTLSEVYRVTAT